MSRYVFLVVLLLLAAMLPGWGMGEGEGTINIESVGYLQVQAQVDGARVYFDRQFMGFINNSALTVPVDVQASPQYSNLIIEYSGYQTFIGQLPKPVAGKTVGILVALNRTGYERMGVVLFESGIPGTELLLNGKSVGVTPDSGILMIHTVPHGLYEFTAKRRGDLTITEQQYVTSNAVTLFRVDLKPAHTGDIRVTTTPAGAGIYLDNRYIGLSPLTIPDIPVGNAVIIVKSEGYQDYSQEIQVTGGEQGQIDAVLVSLPPAPNLTPDCPEGPRTQSPEVPPAQSLQPVQNPVIPDISGNMTLYAGLVVLIGLVGCIVLGVLIYLGRKSR